MALCEDTPACMYASVWIVLIWIIIIPFEVYATIKLWKYRTNAGVQARYPTLIIGSAIFSIAHTLIVEQFYYLQSGIHLRILNTYYVRWIARIIFPPFLLIMLVGIAFRIYLIHYNTNYAVSQSARDWQSLLYSGEAGIHFPLLYMRTYNYVHIGTSSDFYSKYKKTYGSPVYVSRYFICYIIICSLIEMTVTILEHPNLLNLPQIISGFVHFSFLFILILFSAFCGHKTPTFEDAYFVHLELKYLLYLIIVCLVIYIVMMSLSSDQFPIFIEISTSAITIANFGQVVISEYVILRKMNQVHGHSSPKPSLSYRHRVRTKSNVNPKNALIASTKLFNVLIASPIGINYFVQHLRSEFCLENLLCFIELVQWIYIATNGDFSHFNIKPLDKIEFELSRAIPLSSANRNYSNDNECEWRWDDSISAIYEKYFDATSEYQVNMPYKEQKKFQDLIALLNIRQEIENETYEFKHQRMSLKKKRKGNRVLFWTKRTKQSKPKPMTMKTVSIPSPTKTPTKTLSKTPTPNTKLSKSKSTTSDGTDILSATTAGIDLEMGSFPKYLLRLSKDAGTVSATNSASLKSPTFKSQYESDLSTIDDIVTVNDELITYKDPEITDTGTQITGTDQQILNGIFMEEMQRPSIKETKSNRSLYRASNENSVKTSLQRISSMIPIIKLGRGSSKNNLSNRSTPRSFTSMHHANIQSTSVHIKPGLAENVNKNVSNPSTPWTTSYGMLYSCQAIES